MIRNMWNQCRERRVDHLSAGESKVTMKHTEENIKNSEVVVKSNRSSRVRISGGRALLSTSVLLLCLSVITTHLVVLATAQLAQSMQQISSSPHDTPLLARHGGSLYAPQHGYDNNIEFINEHAETIYEVPGSSDVHDEVQEQVPGIGIEEDLPPSIGAGDTYLNNGAPELEPDSDLQHRHHHHNLDDSLNENQLPEEDELGKTSEFTELDGGIIVGERILRQEESPYVLNTDLEVERGGRLTIEPGVTIEFAPMVGITVRGIISAVVSDTLPCNWSEWCYQWW